MLERFQMEVKYDPTCIFAFAKEVYLRDLHHLIRKQGRPCLSSSSRGRPHSLMERMNWIILIVAGLFEVGWAVGLKYTEGFTRLWPSVLTVFAIAISMFLLAIALRTLPTGTAYAVWVGVGIVGTAIAGVVLFSEPVNLVKGLGVVMIIAGIVMLKLGSTGDAH